jgi:hypothetical protein
VAAGLERELTSPTNRRLDNDQLTISACASRMRQRRSMIARYRERASVADEEEMYLIAAVLEVEEKKEDPKRTPARVCMSTHTPSLVQRGTHSIRQSRAWRRAAREQTKKSDVCMLAVPAYVFLDRARLS